MKTLLIVFSVAFLGLVVWAGYFTINEVASHSGPKLDPVEFKHYLADRDQCKYHDNQNACDRVYLYERDRPYIPR
jgi:hypothetical protein